VHRHGQGKRIKGEDSDTHTHVAENTNKFQYTKNISRKLKKKNVVAVWIYVAKLTG